VGLVHDLKQINIKSKRIFSFFTPYWKRWLILFLVSLLLSLLGLVNPLIVKFLIDRVFLEKAYDLLKNLMLVFVGLTLLATITRVITNYFYRKLELDIIYDVRNKLFHHLEALHLGFFQKKRLGDILSRLSSDIGGIEEFISLVFNGLIANLLTFIFILAISLALNWRMTVIVLFFIPLYLISQYYFGGKIRGFYKLLKRQGAILLSFLEEKLSAIFLIQLFGREDYELQREKTKMKEIISTSLKTSLTSSLASNIIALITFLALLFILWYGGYQVIIGMMSLGSLIAIYSYLGGLFSPLEALVGLYTAMQNSLASADRVFEILDIKPAVSEKIGAPKMPKIKGEIVFDNVSFAFNNEPVLKNISFRINPGEVVAFVGASGSGKTTLVNLIARFYDPIQGAIFIDGRNIKEVDLQSLRKQIGLASQNVILFNASIRENMSYGHFESISWSEIKAAARDAEIDKVIELMPRKYMTRIGEKGMTLSGGERQRLAIARLILKHPQIIILDEATSFLDFETELRVMQNIRRIFTGKTIIIIAHRLSILEDTNRIFVLKNGSIVEEGKFKELIEKRGEFFRFYSYQIGGFNRFTEKLGYELDRALRERLPLAVIGFHIKNIASLISSLGEKGVLEILDGVIKEMDLILPPPYFSSQDLDRRELIYIVLPETDEDKANFIVSKLLSAIMKKFPDIKMSIKIVMASDLLNEPSKILNAVASK